MLTQLVIYKNPTLTTSANTTSPMLKSHITNQLWHKWPYVRVPYHRPAPTQLVKYDGSTSMTRINKISPTRVSYSNDQCWVLTADTTCPIRKSHINDLRRYNGSNTRVWHSQPALTLTEGPKLTTSTKTTCIIQGFHKKDLNTFSIRATYINDQRWHNCYNTRVKHQRQVQTQMIQNVGPALMISADTTGAMYGSDVNNQRWLNWSRMWVYHWRPAMTQQVQRDSPILITSCETAGPMCWSQLVLVRYQVLFDTDRYLNFVRYSILDTRYSRCN